MEDEDRRAGVSDASPLEQKVLLGVALATAVLDDRADVEDVADGGALECDVTTDRDAEIDSDIMPLNDGVVRAELDPLEAPDDEVETVPVTAASRDAVNCVEYDTKADRDIDIEAVAEVDSRDENDIDNENMPVGESDGLPEFETLQSPVFDTSADDESVNDTEDV